ncbi:hypothetical protein Tco_0564216 [Tanacetum coccineum]
MICHKDFSDVSDDEESEYNDEYQYEDDDDEEEYEYLYELMPTLLPTVDILPCGYANHTECSQEEVAQALQIAVAHFIISPFHLRSCKL